MALKYALSTSFGTLCFASLVSAPVAVVNWVFRPEQEEREDEEEPGLGRRDDGEEGGGCLGLCAVDWTLRRWRTTAWETMQMDSTVRWPVHSTVLSCT